MVKEICEVIMETIRLLTLQARRDTCQKTSSHWREESPRS